MVNHYITNIEKFDYSDDRYYFITEKNYIEEVYIFTVKNKLRILHLQSKIIGFTYTREGIMIINEYDESPNN